MLISALMWLIFAVFGVLTYSMKIPSMPSEGMDYLNTAFEYIGAGAGLLANYTPFSYLMTLFIVIIGIDIGIKLYHFVMWVIKKIPILNIK